MGRPQAALDRDGSPVRELAFWLRDLRSRSGLTYQQLSSRAHYATSTLQAAAAGHRLPTWRVVRAFVQACGGDEPEWQAYWAQIKRAMDHAAPCELRQHVLPPWAGPAPAAVASGPQSDSPVLSDTPAADDGPSQEGAGQDGSWYIRSFVALLRMDTDPPEAQEHRIVVATADGLTELTTAVSVPRHPADSSSSHRLEVELLHGGLLQLREQPWETYFRNMIVLPRALRVGEQHEYALRLRVPPGQPMAAHYVHVPHRRSDYFELRVRFHLDRLPRAVWMLPGVPTAVIYQRSPFRQTLVPNLAGEVHVKFRQLQVGLGYGVCWQE
jgi:Helix-turn-helix domain